MMWQDFVFLIGSGLSVVFLAPTLRDATARVPLGTSLPSMAIGFVYGLTFVSLGMTFSAAGSIAAGTMWSLIALVRSPTGNDWLTVRRREYSLFAEDAVRWFDRRRSGSPRLAQYEIDRPVYEHADD
ncbi:hypothetical protein [Natronobacterium gregoryi]|uniref:Uncharacterized protein n=2 Tax=Natronobacterium gregoryi TaxID=44930 RepID=L0AHM1_NATGS|nr:hypothetical protein [Natronobacterium gregoryi]AFZ72637.1 hypothetical protein Natgr_1426 [Natronobacterium gregoryi SP2]ELY69075.1 hypothetical protein C490_08791 [Natronobacterium gregoryi SP2]PLK19111.1 hypothetical protein CYV19_16650 [Natronobacterium gregoryi SP2]SFI90365.1 hypothetical protein SAMN05443661_10918 [Natronobacterium gregoryi]